jgi:mannose-6-phosphate isomerase-like protein (cupin superfamily)
VLAHPADGETITDREGRQVIMLAAHEQITVHWYRIAPGEVGPGPHVHRRHADSFYVLDGELTLALGPDRERVRMAAGGLVTAPPGVVHTFANDGDAEVTFLNLHTPDGGFAAFMRARREGDESAGFDSFEPPADGGRPLSDAVIAGRGEGELLVSGPRAALVKAALPELFLAEFEIDGLYDPPGMHDHQREVDSFYVLEGELEVSVEDDRHLTGPHTLAAIPPGVRHTFAKPGSAKARFLNIHAPDAGFAEFLRRVSD